MVSNWQRWVGQIEKKSVSINQPTHARLRAISDETSMSMQFWADAAIRFFLAHTKSAALINAAKGVTLEEYTARVNAADRLITHLIEHGMEEPETDTRPLLEPIRRGEEVLRRETVSVPHRPTTARQRAEEAANAVRPMSPSRGRT